MSHRIAIVTTGRQDWGILRPVVDVMVADAGFEPLVIAGGMHFRDDVNPTALDGIPVAQSVIALPADDSPLSVARCAADTARGYAEAFADCRPDAVLLLGDRTETLAVGLAATCLEIPIIHLHGGEESTGASDNACRHALTRLAHLHCVSHVAFARRLREWEINPSRIHVTGAPAIDQMLATRLPDRQALSESLGFPIDDGLILMTHHPVTAGAGDGAAEIAAVIDALRQVLATVSGTVVMTRPNVDRGGAAILAALTEVAAADERFHLVSDLGTHRYWGLMSLAAVVVGNSSSGIIEAPSFQVPTVNIGDRQGGRLRVHPVWDVRADADAIAKAIEQTWDPPSAQRCAQASPYGDGKAAVRILKAINDFLALPRQEMLRGQHLVPAWERSSE